MGNENDRANFDEALISRIMALEIVLSDALATMLQRGDDPAKAAKTYRERLKTVMATFPLPKMPPGQYETLHGDISDAVDRLAGQIEATVGRFGAPQKSNRE